MEAGTAPVCPRCTRRHLPFLRCWSGRYVTVIRARMIGTYGTECCHCGKPGAVSVEHVQPRAFGGTDDLANLRPAHLDCNLRRGTQPMDGWRPDPLTTEKAAGW